MLISRYFMKRHECIECKPVFSTQTVVGVSFGIRVPREQYPSHAFPSAITSPFLSFIPFPTDSLESGAKNHLEVTV